MDSLLLLVIRCVKAGVRLKQMCKYKVERKKEYNPKAWGLFLQFPLSQKGSGTLHIRPVISGQAFGPATRVNRQLVQLKGFNLTYGVLYVMTGSSFHPILDLRTTSPLRSCMLCTVEALQTVSD